MTFWDLPNGAFFRAVNLRGSVRVEGDKYYQKVSQGTAVRVDFPGIVYGASEFWEVVESNPPTVEELRRTGHMIR